MWQRFKQLPAHDKVFVGTLGWAFYLLMLSQCFLVTGLSNLSETWLTGPVAATAVLIGSAYYWYGCRKSQKHQ